MGAPPDTGNDTTVSVTEVLVGIGFVVAAMVFGLPLLGAALGLVAYIGATVVGMVLWLAPVLIALAVLAAAIRFIVDP